METHRKQNYTRTRLHISWISIFSFRLLLWLLHYHHITIVITIAHCTNSEHYHIILVRINRLICVFRSFICLRTLHSINNNTFIMILIRAQWNLFKNFIGNNKEKKKKNSVHFFSTQHHQWIRNLLYWKQMNEIFIFASCVLLLLLCSLHTYVICMLFLFSAELLCIQHYCLDGSLFLVVCWLNIQRKKK